MSTNRAPAAAPAGPASAPASTSATTTSTTSATTRPTNTSSNPSATKPAAAAAQASVVIKEEDPKVETLIATVEGASPGAGNMAQIAASARQIAAECRRQQALARSVPVPPTNTISLASNDGRVFSVRVEVARRFGIVRDMLDHNILQAEVAAGESEPVPLSRISGPTLELAIAWAENYLKRHPRSPTTSSTATTAVKSERGQQATTSSSSKGRSTSEEGPEIFYRRPKKVGGGSANKASSSSSSATSSEEHASAVMQYRRSMHDLEYWDSEFLGALSPGKLQDLLNAANYLDSAELLESTCKMIARMIQAQLELDGPSGVAAFMQVPVAMTSEERKRKAEKEAMQQQAAASTEAGGSSAGIPAAVKQLNANAGPTQTVNGVINSCERRVRMKLKSGQIKSEDDDGEVTWAGLVLPELYIEAGASNSRRRAEVSTQAPEPGVEVSDAFVID